MGERLCRLCGERPVSPSRLRGKDYRCSWCINHTPAARARIARYRQSAGRAEVVRRENARRVFVGRDYYARLANVHDAQRINAYIKGRRDAFIAGQSHREEAQGAQTR